MNLHKIILLLITFMIGCFANAQSTSVQNLRERCVSGEETHFSAKFIAPKNVVDKSWKAKIHGSAQATGTPGHQFRMLREAVTEAKKPNVVRVDLDHGYNRALRLAPKTITSNRRPDVISIYDNNFVRRLEVQSKTDVPAILRSRNSALDPLIIQNGFTPTPPVVIKPTLSPNTTTIFKH